jgi:hypothetical protein
MTDLSEVKNDLAQVLHAIQTDRTLLSKQFKTENESTRITAENLADLTGNHLFDDFPNLFGITSQQGHRIRAYFLKFSTRNPYNFVLELHKAFPEYMEDERPEYLEKIRKAQRKS